MTHYQRIIRSMSILTLAALILFLGNGRASAAPPAADPAIVARCMAELAQRLTLPAQAITLVDAQATTWPDAALGMPEIGKMYAQVLTPGWKIILDARGTQYLYTAGAKAIRYGGPVPLWSYSLLSITPAPNEPNLNGDLYQRSLTGTNSTRIATGVSAYYPQQKGMILFTRRTSRSSFELYSVNADGKGKATKLYGAFDIGKAALNDAQDTWAAFVRPTLGAGWCVVVARMGGPAADAKVLPLPDGIQPGQIAWSGTDVYILVSNGDEQACYTMTPAAEKPAWKMVTTESFPGKKSYLLSKSESLEITQQTVNGKPSVEVARVWFTGERKVKATIDGLTMRDNDLLGLRFAVIRGEKAGKPILYTVDIATGEVIPGFYEADRDTKTFDFPPVSKP